MPTQSTSKAGERTQSIAALIQETCANTEPKTKDRNAALKAIKWVLATTDGEEGFAILNGITCCLTSYVDSAIKFTGLDNEQLKADFWSKQLGRKMEAVLL